MVIVGGVFGKVNLFNFVWFELFDVILIDLNFDFWYCFWLFDVCCLGFVFVEGVVLFLIECELVVCVCGDKLFVCVVGYGVSLVVEYIVILYL